MMKHGKQHHGERAWPLASLIRSHSLGLLVAAAIALSLMLALLFLGGSGDGTGAPWAPVPELAVTFSRVLPWGGKSAVETATEQPPEVEVSGTDPNFKSQNGQDRWLLENLFSGKDQHAGSGFFVEFGARNGISESNTYFFEKTLGWHGILAEASPEEQGSIVAERNSSAVVNGAICKTTGNITFGNIGGGWGGIVETYDPSRNENRKEEIESQSVTVQCYTLADILSRFGVRAIDFMSVDTEGSEINALSTFPFDKIPCRVISIEVLIGEKRDDRIPQTTTFMEAHGFRLLRNHRVADDTVDLMFEPAEIKDPSVFSQPRVDMGAFLAARERCKEEEVCL